MKYAKIETPLGQMIAAGDDEKLYLLEFSDDEVLSEPFAKLGAYEKIVLSAPLQSAPPRLPIRQASSSRPAKRCFASGDGLEIIDFSPAPSFAKGSSEKTKSIESIEKELKLYFQGRLQQFKTPLALSGTVFQQKVWLELQKIPYAKTCSYAELAQNVGRPKSFRAAAQANKRNKFAIIIPCHRVINSDGSLGGYFSGVERKKWLLDFEAHSVISTGV